MTEEPPKSPADPRPNGEPYYRESTCDECGEDLVLEDSLSDEQRKKSDALSDPEYHDDTHIWHDAWVCPSCLDGVYMDWPEEEYEKLKERTEGEFVPLEDLDGGD